MSNTYKHKEYAKSGKGFAYHPVKGLPVPKKVSKIEKQENK